MSTASSETLLELAKIWFDKKGFYYIENTRIKGYSGRIYDVDLAVFTDNGLTPVLNIGDTLNNTVIVKVSRMIKDLGSREAVILVSKASSTELKAARDAKIDVLTEDGLRTLITLAENGLDTVFLLPKPEHVSEASQLAESKCAGRLQRLIRHPRVEWGLCIYTPFYIYHAISPPDRLVSAVISSLSGGLLYLEKGSLRESMLNAIRLPDELKVIYARLRGSRISKRDFLRIWGRKEWGEFVRTLSKLDLIEMHGRDEIKVVDDVPDISGVDSAADEFLVPATRSPASECRVALPRVSPGKAASDLYRITGIKAISFTLIMAPLYVAKISGGLCGLTLWLDPPLTYKPVPASIIEAEG